MMPHRIRPIAFLAVLFLLPAGLASAQPCDDVLNTAQVEYNRGQYVPVIDQLRACLQTDRMTASERGLAYRLIAMSHLELRQREEAAEAVRRMLDTSPYYRVNPEADSRSFIELVETERRRRARTARSTYLQEMEPFRFNFNLESIFRSGNDTDGMHAGFGSTFGLSYFLSPEIGIDAFAKYGVLFGSFVQLEADNIDPGDNVPSSDQYPTLELGIGIRYQLSTSSIFAPYLGAGVNYRSTGREVLTPVVDEDEEMQDGEYLYYDVAGVGATVYGGVLMAMTPSLALDLQVRSSFGPLQNTLLESLDHSSVNTVTTHIGLGIVWAPIYR